MQLVNAIQDEIDKSMNFDLPKPRQFRLYIQFMRNVFISTMSAQIRLTRKILNMSLVQPALENDDTYVTEVRHIKQVTEYAY